VPGWEALRGGGIVTGCGWGMVVGGARRGASGFFGV
jgi:hypothetical protein